jgi:sulfur-oxidizing protein SoxB
MNRREFLEVLAVAAAAGMPLAARDVLAQPDEGQRLYDVPRFGNVSLLHFTDCHAQLKPVRFREPSVNLGVGDALGKPPHLVGEALLKRFGIRPGTREARSRISTSSRRRAATARSAASRTWPRSSSA